MDTNIYKPKTDKHLWIAEQVFAAFPHVGGLKFYTLDCGCTYYHRVFPNGMFDPNFGFYRDEKDGVCAVCMQEQENWKSRVVDESIIYKSGFQLMASS